MARNSRLDRLRRFGGDHLQAVEQRQAGLDAAHDDVDGVRKSVEKLVLAPLLEKRQQPARQAEAAGKAQRDGGRRPTLADEQPATNSTTPMTAGDDEELSASTRSGPACAMRIVSGGLLVSSCAAPRSPSACFRRCRGATSAWRARRARDRLGPRDARHALARLCARPTGSDRRKPRPGRRRRRRRGRRPRVVCMVPPVSRSSGRSTASAASSAAARRFSSP